MPPRRLPSKGAALGIAAKRASLSLTAPDVRHLVRIYLLDGSSKVLQGSDSSTVEDMLEQMKYNMDLGDISTCALFRVVEGQGARRMELTEIMKDAIKDTHELDNSGTYYIPRSYSPTNDDEKEKQGAVRILFRTWIHAKSGVFDREVFQYHERHKTHNSAIWLAYMEANFMCMTGRYYLSDDESIMLGCLKMQADSGDFDPEVHTLSTIMERVCTRFPKPISTQMRALMSPTLTGNGMAEDLSSRIQFLYARIAGKHKVDAQIEFLQSLRTWCPFYGGTFFTVQCQYDDGTTDDEPPVQTMNVAIGPLAIFLITQTEPLVILRHPYKRIVKWIAYRDKHIFCYWVLKQHLTLRDVEIQQQKDMDEAKANNKLYSIETDFDATIYCDCVYLVTPQCAELEYLVRSYVQLLKNDSLPKLKGAKGELLPPNPNAACTEIPPASAPIGGGRRPPPPPPGVAPNGTKLPPPPPKVTPIKEEPTSDAKNKNRRKSTLGALFSALGGFSSSNSNKNNDDNNNEQNDGTPVGSPTAPDDDYDMSVAGGTGIGSDSADEEDRPGGSSGFGDDCAGASSKSNLFRNVYASPYRRGSIKGGTQNATALDDDESLIPPQIQFAASMSELHRLATTSSFSDDDNDDDDDDDDSDGDSDDSHGTDGSRKSVRITRENKHSAFRRVSSILFGSGQAKSLDKSSGAGSEVDGGSESEYETDTDDDSD
jgi:hypothetical protein